MHARYTVHSNICAPFRASIILVKQENFFIKIRAGLFIHTAIIAKDLTKNLFQLEKFVNGTFLENDL
jgi:hypothetical protein